MNKKIYHDVISGKSDYNIKYSDLQNLILELGLNSNAKEVHTPFIITPE